MSSKASEVAAASVLAPLRAGASPDEERADAIQAMQDGWTLLISQAKIIALLPLEEWLESFSRAETLAPILDPTLYRDYIYDPDQKGELIKDLIRAAVPLKRELLKLQKRFADARLDSARPERSEDGRGIEQKEEAVSL